MHHSAVVKMSKETLQIKNRNLGAAAPTSWIDGGLQRGADGDA